MLMLWGPGMQPIPSNDQRAKLPDIILCGRDFLKVPGSENTVRLPHSNLHKVGKREITVIIEWCGNATNVMSPRWTWGRHGAAVNNELSKIEWHGILRHGTLHIPGRHKQSWRNIGSWPSSFPKELNRSDRALDPLGQVTSKVCEGRNNDWTGKRIGSRLRLSTEERVVVQDQILTLEWQRMTGLGAPKPF